MKVNKQIIAAALAAVSATSASAADVVINITGSSAFRGPIHNSIVAAMGGNASATYSYAGTSLTGALYALFRGNFEGITLSGADRTVIRTGWSGSADGIRDIIQGNLVPVFNLPGTTITTGVSVAPIVSPGQVFAVNDIGAPTQAGLLTTGVAHIALSDIYQASTTFTSPPLTDAVVGVIPFGFVASNGAPASLTNVSAVQMRQLLGNGSAPLSFFTGVAADTRNVYAVGRDAGSGTRAVALADTGYGIFTPVNQFLVTSSSGVASALTPVGDGGYSTGFDLRTAFSATATSVSVDGGPNENALFIGHVGISDGTAIQNAGGRFLTYNGVSLVNSSNVTNFDAVRRGAYTFWSYQHLLNVALTTNETAVRTSLINRIPNNLGTTGITILSMGSTARLSGTDGGFVTP